MGIKSLTVENKLSLLPSFLPSLLRFLLQHSNLIQNAAFYFVFNLIQSLNSSPERANLNNPTTFRRNMAVAVAGRQKPSSDASLFTLCPFWSSRNATQRSTKTVSSVARSLLRPRRKLRLDPSSYLYFPCKSHSNSYFYASICSLFVFFFFSIRRFFVNSVEIFVYFEDEPGKQVRSAVRLKNTSKSHVAFKVRVVEVCIKIKNCLLCTVWLKCVNF